MAETWILGVSILVQFAAAALAFRLNWIYGHRWSWTLISTAVLFMALSRCITFYRLVTLDTVDDVVAFVPNDGAAAEAVPPEAAGESFVAITSSLLTLAISLIMLIGVALVDPLFRAIGHAEVVLKKEKQKLEQIVRVTDEKLRIAREIQQMLFPRTAPSLDGFEIAGSSHPAEATGGDYYDFIPMPDGRLGIVVADVSGHGIGPALIMAEVRAYLRALARTHTDVGELLTLTNRLFSDDLAEGHFVTIFFGRLDPRTGSLVYASAAQKGYLLDASGTVTHLQSTSVPLGFQAETQVPCSPEMTLRPGQILLLITDGVTEAESADHTLFGIERTVQIVQATRDKPAAEIVQALHQAVSNFSEHVAQKDDITAVVLKADLQHRAPKAETGSVSST